MIFDKSIAVFFIIAYKSSPLQVIGYGHNLRNLFMQIRDIGQVVVYRWVKSIKKSDYDVAATWNENNFTWSLSEVTGEIGLDRIPEGELAEMKGIYERTPQ